MKTEDREYDTAQPFHADELFLHNASTIAFGNTASLGNKTKQTKTKKNFGTLVKIPEGDFSLITAALSFVLHHQFTPFENYFNVEFNVSIL